MKENINFLERREFFYHNFLEIFDEDENIPVHILIEPLIQTIRNNQDKRAYIFFSSDFEFFDSLGNHPRL